MLGSILMLQLQMERLEILVGLGLPAGSVALSPVVLMSASRRLGVDLCRQKDNGFSAAVSDLQNPFLEESLSSIVKHSLDLLHV